MKRREFLQRALLTPGVAAIAGSARVATQGETPRIAFTFDDFNVFDVPALSGASRNQAILDALRANGLKAAVWLRVPLLDEGVTADQRDWVRGFLADTGFDTELRYPGEDGAYEAPKMDALGL